MSLPPPPKPPPAPQKNNQGQVYRQYVLNHHLKAYSDLIWKWAKVYGVDPVYMAALVYFESGGRPGAISSAGAVGLGQVMPGKKPPWMDHAVTSQELKNPNLNLRIAAWYFSQQVSKYGSYRAAYYQGYNPGYSGAGPFASIPRGYVARGTGLSPTESVSVGVEKQVAKARNPYLQGQAFLDLWHTQINPLYEAYTGRMATRAEARQAIGNGWSDYHIRLMLSQRKSFIGSPVWKSFAPGYAAAYQAIYGDRNPDDRLIAYAIVHNLGATGFQQMLRQGKGYVKSEEFAQNVSSLDGVYRQIYGSPDVNGTYVIKQATLAGWSQDQFAKYLRAQPEYQHSSEYQNNAAQLASVFGGAETMTLTQALQAPAPTTGVPHDKRLGPAPWEQDTEPPPEGKQLRAKPVPKRRGPPPMKAKAIDPRTMRGAYS